MAYEPHPESEMAALRRRLSFAEGELRRIELETATAAIARREEIAREEKERAETERKAAADAELENHRRTAWYNVRLDASVEAGDEVLAAFITAGGPEHHMKHSPPGWPPGHDPSQYRRIPLDAPAEPGRSDTALGAALAKVGVKI